MLFYHRMNKMSNRKGPSRKTLQGQLYDRVQIKEAGIGPAFIMQLRVTGPLFLLGGFLFGRLLRSAFFTASHLSSPPFRWPPVYC